MAARAAQRVERRVDVSKRELQTEGARILNVRRRRRPRRIEALELDEFERECRPGKLRLANRYSPASGNPVIAITFRLATNGRIGH